MKKRGFTLIELLAVLVILVIIMAIATPIILGIIDESRVSARKSSAEMYLQAIELEILNPTYTGTTADFAWTDHTLAVNGDAPTAISVYVEADGTFGGGTITFDGFTVTISDGRATAVTNN